MCTSSLVERSAVAVDIMVPHYLEVAKDGGVYRYILNAYINALHDLKLKLPDLCM